MHLLVADLFLFCYAANASDTDLAFLDMNLPIHNDTVSTIYDARDDFDFNIVNFPSLIAMSLVVPFMVYIYIYISSYSLCQSIFAF